MWKFDLTQLEWELLDNGNLFPEGTEDYGFTKYDADDLKFIIYGGFKNTMGYSTETWV